MKNTMLTYKKYSVLVVMLLALMLPYACQKDKLTTAPNNSLSDATAFSTPDRFVSLVNGLYDAMKSGAFYGSRYMVYGDIRAE